MDQCEDKNLCEVGGMLKLSTVVTISTMPSFIPNGMH